MSLAIDSIILFAVIFIVWAGTSHGFVRAFMGLVSTAASAFAAYSYTPVAAAYVKEKYLLERITNGIYETLSSLAIDTETGLFNLDRLATDLPEPFTTILTRYGINISEFNEKISGLTTCGEETVRRISGDIADPTAGILAYTISFLAIFVAALVILAILTGILDTIFRLPVLRGANTFMGFVFGLLEAIAVAVILSVILSSLVAALGAIDPSTFGDNVVSDTVICSKLISTGAAKSLKALLSI